MSDELPSQDDIDAIERAKLNQETATMPWHELQRYFAAGKVIRVAEQLDLVDVALQVSKDNRSQVEQWMSNGQVGQVSDEQAQTWFERNATLWCVVVRPWVLVQYRPTQ